jgi:hypothetical protein
MNRLNCKQLLTCYMLKFSIVALHAVCIRKKEKKKLRTWYQVCFEDRYCRQLKHKQ